MTLDLPPFTLVGATTRAGLLRRRCATASASSTASSPTRRRPRARSCAARAAILGVELDDGGAWAIASRSPRHAARRQPAAQARPRLGRGPGHRRRRRRRGRRRARAARGRRARPRPPRPRDPADDLRAVRRRARSASRRSRSPSARSPTRSRTSTSPTCCSGADPAHPARPRGDPPRLRAPRARGAGRVGAVLSRDVPRPLSGGMRWVSTRRRVVRERSRRVTRGNEGG